MQWARKSKLYLVLIVRIVGSNLYNQSVARDVDYVKHVPLFSVLSMGFHNT